MSTVCVHMPLELCFEMWEDSSYKEPALLGALGRPSGKWAPDTMTRCSVESNEVKRDAAGFRNKNAV